MRSLLRRNFSAQMLPANVAEAAEDFHYRMELPLEIVNSDFLSSFPISHFTTVIPHSTFALA